MYKIMKGGSEHERGRRNRNEGIATETRRQRQMLDLQKEAVI